MSGGAKTVRLKGKGRAAETTADYYVSAAGSDNSGDGSAANPWATIAHADAQVSPGSTVHVAPGTYTGSFGTNTSGTPEARIRFISDVKWGAKLVGTLESTWSSYGDYVDIVGFDVTGPGLNGIFAGGNFARVIGTHVHDITVACTGIGGSGINFPATNGDALGNYVHDIGPYPTPCNFTHGIYFLNAGGHAYNNIVFRAAGWGIQLWHSASGIVVANNTLFDNLHGGVIVGADAVIDDNTIVNNNIVFNNARGIFEEGTTGTHNVYQNNLIFQNSLADLSLQNGNTAADTVSADPQFVNFSGDPTGDYHLQSASPAIDTGTSNAAPVRDYDGVARPQGNAWTIGAFEVVAPDQDDRDHGRRRSCSGERGGRCEHSPRGVGHSKHDDDDD